LGRLEPTMAIFAKDLAFPYFQFAIRRRNKKKLVFSFPPAFTLFPPLRPQGEGKTGRSSFAREGKNGAYRAM